MFHTFNQGFSRSFGEKWWHPEVWRTLGIYPIILKTTMTARSLLFWNLTFFPAETKWQTPPCFTWMAGSSQMMHCDPFTFPSNNPVLGPLQQCMENKGNPWKITTHFALFDPPQTLGIQWPLCFLWHLGFIEVSNSRTPYIRQLFLANKSRRNNQDYRMGQKTCKESQEFKNWIRIAPMQ